MGRIWGNPRYGDWDLDDIEAFLLPEEWEGLSDDMAEALATYRDGTLSVPWWLLKPINDRVRDQGIEPKAWWAELYGR